MTNKTKTILEVKKEISLLLSEVHCITNCFLEFDEELQVEKIVVIITDISIEPSLVKFLSAFVKYGHRIVIRKDDTLFHFHY